MNFGGCKKIKIDCATISRIDNISQNGRMTMCPAPEKIKSIVVEYTFLDNLRRTSTTPRWVCRRCARSLKG